MLDKLRGIAQRYEEITNRLYQPEVTTQPDLYSALMKEANALRPIADAYAQYTAQQARLSEAEEMLAETDKDLRQLAQEEYADAKAKLTYLTEEIKILLLPRNPNDNRNVIVEIRAGAGGEESALFAHSLHRMYTMYAETAGFKTSRMSQNETELGGFREITFIVSGDGA